MGVEAGHIQIQEFSREVIPQINWMLEDLFCRYGVAMPYFLLDFDFPDYSGRPDWITYSPEWPSMYWPEWAPAEWKEYWPSFLTQWPDWLPTNGFSFGSDWGKWGYWLTWLNELLGLLFDEANLPREALPDLSEDSAKVFNDYINILYDYVTGTREISTYDALTVSEYMVREYIFTPEDDFQELRRYAAGINETYDDAKSTYENDPSYSTQLEQSSGHLRWTTARSNGAEGTNFTLHGQQILFKYNTSTLNHISTVEMRVYASSIVLENTVVNPVLRIYKYDYGDSIGEEDYTGGTLIAERTFTTADEDTWVTMDIEVADVTMGDRSKYRLAIGQMEDLDYFPEPDSGDTIQHYLSILNIRLVIVGN